MGALAAVVALIWVLLLVGLFRLVRAVEQAERMVVQLERHPRQVEAASRG